MILRQIKSELECIANELRLFLRGLKKFIIFRLFRSFSPVDQQHVIRCLEKRLKIGAVR